MAEHRKPEVEEFARALAAKAASYKAELDAPARARLRRYYELLLAWNPRLHLVAPCAPAEFATRHVLESLAALPFLAKGAHVTDVGSGGGLPIIPLLIARPDLRATLIEAAPKKAVFLREALRVLDLQARAQVLTARFESLPAPQTDYLTCRALERFAALLPQLVGWAAPSVTFLLFAGAAMRAEMRKLELDFEEVRLVESEQRFLFIARRRRAGGRTPENRSLAATSANRTRQ